MNKLERALQAMGIERQDAVPRDILAHACRLPVMGGACVVFLRHKGLHLAHNATLDRALACQRPQAIAAIA